jgi:hypothetical protein
MNKDDRLGVIIDAVSKLRPSFFVDRFDSKVSDGESRCTYRRNRRSAMQLIPSL